MNGKLSCHPKHISRREKNNVPKEKLIIFAEFKYRNNKARHVNFPDFCMNTSWPSLKTLVLLLQNRVLRNLSGKDQRKKEHT